MVQEVRLARTDVRIIQRHVNLHRLCLDVFTVLIVETFLGNLTDIDFRIEVCSESLVMVSSVTIHDVEVLYLVKVMLCSVSSEDTCHARVEAATEDSAETSLLEALAISPLP